MEENRGIYTSEFWITVVVNIAAAVIAILATRGLVSSQEGELYLALVQALAVAVAPVVMAIVTKSYVDSRAEVKSSVSWNKSNNALTDKQSD